MGNIIWKFLRKFPMKIGYVRTDRKFPKKDGIFVGFFPPWKTQGCNPTLLNSYYNITTVYLINLVISRLLRARGAAPDPAGGKPPDPLVFGK